MICKKISLGNMLLFEEGECIIVIVIIISWSQTCVMREEKTLLYIPIFTLFF